MSTKRHILITLLFSLVLVAQASNAVHYVEHLDDNHPDHSAHLEHADHHAVDNTEEAERCLICLGLDSSAIETPTIALLNASHNLSYIAAFAPPSTNSFVRYYSPRAPPIR